MSKILVVDDETDLEVLIRQKFRKKIKKGQYQFVFASDGRDALQKMQEHAEIDLVLSDINMPGMDGLTLLGKLNEIAPLTKTVMVSAYGDMDNIRTAMNRGAFDFVVKPVNFEDLELTMEKTLLHVQQIKKTLKAVKENNILKMYVDENVLNFMASQAYETALTANEMIEATVMFIDICNFTAISEKETPDKVVQFLNQAFELMVQEIIGQDGQVDKFMGDAIMAIFKGKAHLERAVKTAIAIQHKIKNNTNLITTLPHYNLAVTIGINNGEMISGNIGSASLKRLDYTVIGDPVNLAQRLQSAATPNQILLTEMSFNQINTLFKGQHIGEIKVKNKEEAIVVYEILEK